MKMKWIAPAVALATGVGLGGWAQAGPVVLDDWTAAQAVSATSGTPFVSSTLSAPVVGVAPFLGDRTLEATLTSSTGVVGCSVGAGVFEVSRSVTASGACELGYEILAAFELESISFSGFSDGAFGGSAGLQVWKNGVMIGEQLVSTTLQDYTIMLMTSFTSLDNLGLVGFGNFSTDNMYMALSGEVTLIPEPGSLALTGLAMTGLFWSHRRKQARAS